MNRHELKCEPGHFRDVQLGLKKYEVRYNDRGFNVGDEIELVEYHVHFGELGGRLTAKITHILHGGYGLKPGFAVLGIELIESQDAVYDFVDWNLKIEAFTVGTMIADRRNQRVNSMKPGTLFRIYSGEHQENRTPEQVQRSEFVGPHLVCEKLPFGIYDYKVIEVWDGS